MNNELMILTENGYNLPLNLCMVNTPQILHTSLLRIHIDSVVAVEFCLPTQAQFASLRFWVWGFII